MRAKTENPFRSSDRYFLLVVLPLTLALIVLVGLQWGGLGSYEYTDAGTLVRDSVDSR